jgi:serine/threonine protein kinase
MWDGYWEGLAEAQRLAELQALAQAPQPQVQQAVTAVVQKVAADKPPQVRQRLTTYLTQVPALVRQATRRPTDPSGVTVPPYLRLQKAQDLLPFLPSRMPRFQSGQRPIPGVDLELVELLGMGGFGEVWKAKNPLLPNMPPVALKFCLDAVATKSLRHEAAVLDRVMRQGKHPGIVELRHTYLSTDPPCLEYEYVEGGDLAGLIQEWHRSKGGLSPEQAAKLIHRLAEIVAFAHRLAPAIVHRDLKPANILVKKTKENKITFRVADFGLGGVAAEHVIRKTRLGNTRDLLLTKSVQGAYTPLYASPQQMRGDPPDPRDDVYALGIIWYQMLVGDLTTGAPSGLQWTKLLMQRGMSEPLIRLLAACFEGKPEDRPANAALLVEKLANHLKSGSELPAASAQTAVPRNHPDENAGTDFLCPQCRTILSRDDARGNAWIICSLCGQRVQVPQASKQAKKGEDDIPWVQPVPVPTGLFPPARPAPDVVEQPPPIPGRTAQRRATNALDESVFVWQAWQIWLFSLLTFGLFEFYLVPSWAKQMERITGRPHMPFGVLLLLGICTLGIALVVVNIAYAFELEKHGRSTGHRGVQSGLGQYVLALNIVSSVWSIVWSFATVGIGYLLGGIFLGIWAVWLVQAEINSYAQETLA